MTQDLPRRLFALTLILALTACGGRSLPLLVDGGPLEDKAVTGDSRPATDLPQRRDLPRRDGPRGDVALRDVSWPDAPQWTDGPWWPDAGPIGCWRNKDCAQGQFCYFAVACGTGVPGLCQARPTSCPEIYSPVCGCDGLTYGNECFAHAEGVNVLHSGPCGQQACATDDDCAYGAEWCEQGACVPCDNSGWLCDLACPAGWELLERNGCWPCTCAPPTECLFAADCGPGRTCYPGRLCWDWCPPGDPSCCRGNLCSAQGCDAPPSELGCWQLGCPQGQTCVDQGCSSSLCQCDPTLGLWSCTSDCKGGVCRPN